MQADKVIDVLVGQVDSKVLQLQEALADGRVDNFEEYRKVCGEIRGLLTARNYMTDLRQKMESSNE